MATDLIAILFALSREARPFLRRQPGRARLEGAPCPAWVLEGGHLVCQTGMGAEATTRALGWLVGTRHPSRVLSAGFCGSLVESCRVGDLLLPGEVVSHTGERWATVSGQGTRGRLLSVDVPVLGTPERRELFDRTGAEIVDMESATVAALCDRERIHFHAVRVVSDDLAHPLPADLLPALDGESVRLGKLCRALVCRPSLLRDLMRLGRETKKLGQILAEGVERLLLSLTGSGR